MASPRNQSQYDLFTASTLDFAGANNRAESQPASRVSKPDAGNEEWRAQIHKLQYEVDSLKQEQEAASLRHQEELRRLQNRADVDYKRAQASESSEHAASTRNESLSRELHELREQLISVQNEYDKQIHAERNQKNRLQEEFEDFRIQHSEQDRHFRRQAEDFETKLKSIQQTADELRLDRDEKSNTLQDVQARLSQRESEAGDFENEVMRLRTQAGDSNTVEVLKRELTQQVAHIKELEATSLDQRIELEHFRKKQKSIEIIEEEKRSLESKVRMMVDMRKELGEMRLQKQILEDERRSWAAYLKDAESDGDQLQFSSPEDLARAFVKERFEKASLVDQMGKISPELNAKDEIIVSLQEQISRMKFDAQNTSLTSTTSDSKAYTRLERQRNLATKEIEYLRAQIKAFETEESEMQGERLNEQKGQTVEALERVVDEYREEIKTLQEELKKSEDNANVLELSSTSTKRGRANDADDTRLGELFRRNRTLQDNLTKIETEKSILENNLEACRSQLESIKVTSRTRVLELRDNPTAQLQAVKSSTLNALRSENEALLDKLNSSTSLGSKAGKEAAHVPVATLERLRGEMASQNDTVVAKDKQISRLKQVFSVKSKEFREAVASILGWKFDFMPNGRVRVTSLFNPGISEEEGGEGGNSIVFDGDNETMKVSGGPQSVFASEIRSLVDFWVDGRNEIPCFLAACTLEFWEKSTRAQKA